MDDEASISSLGGNVFVKDEARTGTDVIFQTVRVALWISKHMRHDPTRMQHSSSPFLTLPAEIRDEIYQYLFCEPERIAFLLFEDHPDWKSIAMAQNSLRPCPMSSAVPFLQTNGQIYHEAMAILYGHNIFNMTGRQALQFLEAIGQNGRAHLKHLAISYDESSISEIVDYLTQATGLRRLGIIINELET